MIAKAPKLVSRPAYETLQPRAHICAVPGLKHPHSADLAIVHLVRLEGITDQIRTQNHNGASEP